MFSLPLYLLKTQVIMLPTTFLEMAIYGVFGGWLVKRAFEKNYSFKYGGTLVFPAALIVFGVLVASLISIDLRVSLGIFKGWVVDPVLLFFVAINVLKDKRDYIAVYLALIGSGLVVAILSFGYLVKGVITYDGRLSGPFQSPNYLAMYLSPSAILSAILLFGPGLKEKSARIFLSASLLIVVFVLYQTFSYGAWLAAASGFSVAMAVFPSGVKPKKKLAIIGVVMVILLAAQFGTEKAQNLIGSADSSLQSRLIIWQSALNTLKNNFVIGIGPGVFQNYYLVQGEILEFLDIDVPHPHNIFLAFWLYGGLTGFAGFLWLLWRFFELIGKAAKDKKNALIASGALAVMIYFLAHGLMDTTYWKNDLSVIFWVIVAAGYTAGHSSD